MLTTDGSDDFLNRGMNLTESWTSVRSVEVGGTNEIWTGNVDSGHVGKVDTVVQSQAHLHDDDRAINLGLLVD